MNQNKRVIISGGGTGGHIFPAIAIANALKRIAPDTKILFVGAKGRMEMDRVPAAGYEIIGLDIQGFQRKSLLKNIFLPFKMIKSVFNSISILKKFKPDVAIGVGGYASGPLLYAAKKLDIPYLIQEQNSYAGITNAYLGKSAEKICVAFEGMEQFFPADKIKFTGNPIRQESVEINNKREEAIDYFGLSTDKKTILVLGGSLGAGTLNKCMLEGIEQIMQANVQLIWQTGASYYVSIINKLPQEHSDVKIFEFLNRMDLAYAAADIVVSRAGAGTIAELCVVGKPIILVPSPNVAEDHQTKNALALVKQEAAFLVTDQDAEQKLVKAALNLINNPQKSTELSQNIKKMAIANADEIIANEVLKTVKQ